MQAPTSSQHVALGDLDQQNIPLPVKGDQTPPTSVSIPEMMQRAAVSTPLALPPPANSPCLSMKQRIEHALGIRFNDIFSWGNNGKKSTFLDRRAFLLFHPVDHAEELELLTRGLLMHHVDIKNLWFQGGWEHYTEQLTNGGSGVVIVSDPRSHLRFPNSDIPRSILTLSHSLNSQSWVSCCESKSAYGHLEYSYIASMIQLPSTAHPTHDTIA
jgi:hypothetical protein